MKRFFSSPSVPAALFVIAGVAHFVWPRSYRSIVPTVFGDPDTLVALSGVAEIAGGVGLLFPATRRIASLGLIALLIAVWPANWYMALQARSFASVAPAWALWLRVPLQLPLIYWIAHASRRRDR
jgi:uncharacterized membrane protein